VKHSVQKLCNRYAIRAVRNTEEHRSLISKLGARPLMAFAAAVGLLLAAKYGEAQTNGGGRTAEQAFKNIKALQGTPADSFSQGMHLISGSLGVNCEYCHVERDFVSDDIKKKDVARSMITMTADLNRRLFKGGPIITCFTCHQGSAIPRNTPTLPASDYPTPERESKAELPSAEQVLSKYVTALGGEQSLRKITTRVLFAQQDVPTGPGGVVPAPAEIEIYQKAPNLMLRVARTNQSTLLSGFDAKMFWVQDPRGGVASPVELERARETRYADFYEPLNIAKSYANLRVQGTEKVGGSEAYLVVGQPSEGIPVRLYFDTTSGLLVRRYTVVPTAVGNSPFQVDYDDYRDAGSGVKYPYLVRMEPAAARVELRTHSTIHIRRIQENVAMDDVKFLKPGSQGIH